MRRVRTVLCTLAAVVLLQTFAVAGHGGACWWSQPTCWQPAPACYAPQPACYTPQPVCCQPAATCCVPQPMCWQPVPSMVPYTTNTGWACPMYKTMTWNFGTGDEYCSYYALWCDPEPHDPFSWDDACNLDPLGCVRTDPPCELVPAYAPAPRPGTPRRAFPAPLAGGPNRPYGPPFGKTNRPFTLMPLPHRIPQNFSPTLVPGLGLTIAESFEDFQAPSGAVIHAKIFTVTCPPRNVGGVHCPGETFHIALELDRSVGHGKPPIPVGIHPTSRFRGHADVGGKHYELRTRTPLRP